MSLTQEEQQPYIDKALKMRQPAKARTTLCGRSLDKELALELLGGPWSLSASEDALPGDWPLNRALLNATLDKGNQRFCWPILGMPNTVRSGRRRLNFQRPCICRHLAKSMSASMRSRRFKLTGSRRSLGNCNLHCVTVGCLPIAHCSSR